MKTTVVLKETLICNQKSIAEVFHMATTITVFCGAGVSTSAGIPAFRSPGGLYTKSFSLGGMVLRGYELFDVPSLQNREKLALMNQEMAKLRIKSRHATVPKFQKWIAGLNQQGRLRRCYTQNFDGIQLRADQAAASKVYEVHGSNQRLRCRTCSKISAVPIEDFDHILTTVGLAQCRNCQEIAEKASVSAKRIRPIGYLVPDILFNQEVVNLDSEGWNYKLDSKVDLFVIAGTTLKTEGTFQLVRTMAREVHSHGGAVIYVDMGALSKRISTFVDIHFYMETDKFAEYFDKHAAKALVSDTVSFRKKVITLFQQLSARTPTLAQIKLQSLVRIVFILLYTPQSEKEATAYAQAVIRGIDQQGYQVQLVQLLIGSLDHIKVVDTQGCHVFVTFMTSSIRLPKAMPFTQDMEVAEMLYFTRRMIRPQTGQLSVKIFILGHYDAFKHLTLAQRLEHEVRGNLTIKSVVCGLAIYESQVIKWAEWSARLFHNWARISGSILSVDEELEIIRDVWLQTDALYEGAHLWYFCNPRPPLLVLSSPWATRPLGRPLPDINSVCDCSFKLRSGMDKHWKVKHDAQQGGLVSAVTLDIQCLECRYSLQLNTSDMIGVMREYLGRFAVELDLILY